MLQEWVLLPLAGALIGYITNVVAIRMLFRPRYPWKIPGTPWAIQGLIPMRHHDLAKAIGDTVEHDLLPIDNLIDELNILRYRDDAVRTVEEHVDKRIRGSLPKFIPQSLQDTLITFIRDWAGRESGAILDTMTDRLRSHLYEDLRIGEMIERKVMELDLDSLEQLVIRVAHQELRHIEILGAILGLLIGVGQAGLLVLMR